MEANHYHNIPYVTHITVNPANVILLCMSFLVDNICSQDSLFTPHAEIANMYERVHSSYLRSWAVEECLTQIKAEDQSTHYISIAPVRDALLYVGTMYKLV